MENVTLAAHGDLFCIPAGKGFTCLGFDICQDRTSKLAEWLGREELKPVAPRGTLESYTEYQAALDAARKHCSDHDLRCPVELSPQLVGLEGNRVEVEVHGETRRFIVGKSTGWLPCHLEIHNRRSSGGMAAMLRYDSVRVIGPGRNF